MKFKEIYIDVETNNKHSNMLLPNILYIGCICGKFLYHCIIFNF